MVRDVTTMLLLQGTALLSLAVGCESSRSIVGSSLGEATVLRVGDVAEFAETSLRIGFTAVREDSRCPPPETGVVCVWEGVATVVGWAEDAPHARSEIMLATTNAAGHSTVTMYLTYEIELLALTPPHVADIKQSDYRLTLIVRTAA